MMIDGIAYQRFRAKIRRHSCGCWIWDAGKMPSGYGHFKFNGKTLKAHRIAWSLKHGEIPKGMQILHKCDIPSCVNPDHLFLGTHTDNMRDKVRKGRQTKGRGHWSNKLTESQVLEIKERLGKGERQEAIAEQFGLCQATVSQIKLGRAWGWLRNQEGSQ